MSANNLSITAAVLAKENVWLGSGTTLANFTFNGGRIVSAMAGFIRPYTLSAVNAAGTVALDFVQIPPDATYSRGVNIVYAEENGTTNRYFISAGSTEYYAALEDTNPISQTTLAPISPYTAIG